jgi:hypothetical protein
VVTVQKSNEDSQSKSDGSLHQILSSIKTVEENISSALQNVQVSESIRIQETEKQYFVDNNLVLQLTNAVETSNQNIASKIDEVLLLSLDTTALVTKNQNEAVLK